MDRLDRANMMMLSALMLAAVTIGELRIRSCDAETGPVLNRRPIGITSCW